MHQKCFHSRGQHLCKFIGTKESICIKKEFNFGTLTSAGVTSCENSREILFLFTRELAYVRIKRRYYVAAGRYEISLILEMVYILLEIKRRDFFKATVILFGVTHCENAEVQIAVQFSNFDDVTVKTILGTPPKTSAKFVTPFRRSDRDGFCSNR